MKITSVWHEALDVPALGRVVEPGDTLDVPDDVAAGYLVQPGRWEPADQAAHALVDDLNDNEPLPSLPQPPMPDLAPFLDTTTGMTATGDSAPAVSDPSGGS